MSGTPLDDLRAQRDDLDRQVAEGTLAPLESYLALLSSTEIDQFLGALTTAAASLDANTRTRIEQWTKMRDALVKLGQLEVTRLRKLVGVSDAE